ncbi:MAG: ABC transporter ATP-binding protein [Clostridia bacterium]|jgi:ABC-type nitrate/sulfonate/bicarbonate transport system ATPase subunit|nr:ABC transporter ATP-binding protein [Clostridia bacterium]
MKFEHIVKEYPNKRVFQDFSLHVEEGKITALLGESGAGKTTLLKIAAGLTAYEGEVSGRGAVSFLFQSPMLLPNLTVEGNLKFVLPESEWEKIGAMLARVGLCGKEKAYPRALSGGEAQRVSVARAFLFPHEALLLDEPFSALDLSLKRTLIALVGELWREKGSTVLFVTHDPHEAAMLSHRALVLRGGNIAEDIPVAGDLPRDFFTRPPEEERLIRALAGE